MYEHGIGLWPKINKNLKLETLKKLLKLIIVIPAFNAVSERLFSAMRRLWTYLRSSMSENRLNISMVFTYSQRKTGSLIDIENDFVDGNERRKSVLEMINKLATVNPTESIHTIFYPNKYASVKTLRIWHLMIS